MLPAISDPFEFEPTPRTLAAALREFEQLGCAGGGAIAANVRRAALQSFLAYPNEPKPRREWRYDYAALSYDDLQWSTGRAPATLGNRRPRAPSPEVLSTDAPSLVIENAGGLVHLGSLFLESPPLADERRFTLACLADAMRAIPERVAAVHQRIVAPDADRFCALSTAFQNCGAYVDVPEGVRLDAPLQLLWTARPGESSAVFPHTVVRIGAGARATIVERHIGSSESFVAGIVEVDLAVGARLDYIVIQQRDEDTRLLFRRHARCAAGAKIAWHVAELGGGLMRSVVGASLLERRSRADVNAVFFARGFDHVDCAVRIDHRSAEAKSRVVVRGAGIDRAQGRFNGAVDVAAQALCSEATLAFDALALSPRSYLAVASPLDIAAAGAAVSNTAKVGSLAEEELFYVQSRGIARRDAEHMMALAFFEPALRRFPSDALRDEMRAALDVRLDGIPETFSA